MNGANTLSCALRSVPLDIQPLSSLCDEECPWLASHTKRRFQDPRLSILPNCRLRSLLAAAPHIEYRVSAEFATCLPHRGSGFPRRRGQPTRSKGKGTSPHSLSLSLSLPTSQCKFSCSRSLSLSLLPMSVADSKLHRASHSHGYVSNVERTIVVVGVQDKGLQCDSTLIEEKLAKIPWVTNWPFNITAFLLRPHFVCATGRQDRPTVHECFIESFYKRRF